MSLSEQESTENQHPPSHHESAAEEKEQGMQDPEQTDEQSKQSPHRQQYEQFLAELEKQPDPETKLQFAIDFMEASLAQGGTPHFKSFWEARNICLQLFKENIQPTLRSILWAKYNDLSKEARRLKDILDEQSAFAVEQIEIAIKALEDEIAGIDEALAKSQAASINVNSVALGKNLQQYEKIQQELNLLNVQAARINAMRKELIRTDMRVRQKNKFFQRLSSAGDKVFPKRKELIKEISQRFISDVDAFIAQHFSREEFEDPLFVLREEIKTLQNMAKILTLNTHSFTHTRMRLSECWDKIKVEDKERKKERSQQKEVYAKNFEEAMKLIEEFNKNYQGQQPQPSEATKELDEVVTKIKAMELGRDELRTLRETVQTARKIIQDKLNEKEIERANQEQEKEKLKRQKVADLRQQIEKLIQNSASMESAEIESERDAILEAMGAIALGKIEKQDLERSLKPLRDIISDKKESSLLALSDDDRQSLQQLKEVLKQRRARRQEIKNQIDSLRKSSGSSGLDFEQAMNMNDQIAVEKERLEKIDQGIEEVEQKISQLSRR